MNDISLTLESNRGTFTLESKEVCKVNSWNLNSESDDEMILYLDIWILIVQYRRYVFVACVNSNNGKSMVTNCNLR
jgi:hypothetical protein